MYKDSERRSVKTKVSLSSMSKQFYFLALLGFNRAEGGSNWRSILSLSILVLIHNQCERIDLQKSGKSTNQPPPQKKTLNRVQIKKIRTNLQKYSQYLWRHVIQNVYIKCNKKCLCNKDIEPFTWQIQPCFYSWTLYMRNILAYVLYFNNVYNFLHTRMH